MDYILIDVDLYTILYSFDNIYLNKRLWIRNLCMIIYLYTVTKLKLYLFPDLIIWILLSCFWLKFVVFVHLRDSVLVIWMCYFQTWLQQMLKIVLFSFVIVHPIILNTIFSSKTSNIICFSLFFQLNLQNWRVDLWHLGRWKKNGKKNVLFAMSVVLPSFRDHKNLGACQITAAI